MKNRILSLIITGALLAILSACNQEQEIAVTSVTINQPSAEMILGETIQLKATVSPSNATEQEVTWSSSKLSVAIVSETGLVSTVAEGVSTITAAAGGKTGSCTITVCKGFIAVESLELANTELSIVEGDEFTLNATVKPEDATDKTVTWVSSDTKIAMVDDTGKVMAIKEGEAIITAAAGEKTAECKLTVSAKKIDVTMVMLNKTFISMIVGEEQTLVATIVPENATIQTVQWSTSDPGVATVEEGVVKAVKEGSAKIVAYVDGKTAECNVTVNFIPVESITLDKPSLTLYEGEDYPLTATIAPENATYQDITWTSNDSKIATVEDGNIVAVKKGKATIKAEANGKFTLCQVEVLSSIAEISLDKTELSLIVGDIETLTPIITPADATLREKIAWSTSDDKVATVDENGKVKAIKEGTATVSATVEGKKAECRVSVDYVHVSSIDISQTDATLYIGDAITLSATLNPSNVTYNNIEWISSNTDVITVSEVGRVTAVGKGTASVSAKSDGKEDKCTFTVLVPLSSLSFDQSSLTLFNGATATLSVIKNPTDATLRGEITWNTSNSSVTTVNNEGLVTAINKGSANITASVDGCTAICPVSVLASVTGISLNKTSATLNKGESLSLAYSVTPIGATLQGQVSWVSSEPSVASVDNQGNVKAAGAGTADITVSLEGFTATCNIIVIVPVSSISLNKSSLKLQIGSVETLVASVLPSDATDKTVTWESSDASVATVDGNGQVMAVGGGAATITARAGAKVALCNVTVPFPVESITLSHSEESLYVGRVLQLSASVYPQNAEYDTIEWNSTNPNVASVSSNGAVTAKSKGTATITASCNGVTAQCVITVLNALKGLSFEHEEVSIFTGCSEQLSLILDPADATLRSAIVWSSSDNSTVSVSDNGVITGLKNGSAWVTAQVDGCHAECLINVRDKVTGLVLNKEYVTMEKGDSFQLSYQVIPSGANPEGDLLWTSSNPNVAVVNNNGKVDAIAEGEAIITISLNESISASCKIRVVIPVSSIQINQSSVTLDKGKTVQLSAEVLPLNATDNQVNWSSDNPQVATVSNSGLVVAVSGGITKIKAQAGGKTAECEVTVLVPVTSFSIYPVSLTLKKGSSYALRAIITPSDATDQSVTWSSTNKSVVTVDENGLLWAAGGGIATIQASTGGFTAECAVQVTVDVSAVTLDSSSLLIHRGKSYQLTATVLPSDATDKSITWTSSNLSVATVSNGLVCAVGRGTTIIQARVGNKYATCSVTVDVPVEAITLDKKELKLNPANSYSLKATIIPYDADIGNGIVWSSTVPEVAKVNSQGVVTAESEGITFISAVIGNVSASCVVTCERVSGDNEETGNENWK